MPQRHRFSPHLLLPLHYQPFLHPSLTSLLLIFTSAVLLHTQYLPVFSLNQVTTLLLISSSFPPFFFPLSILFHLSIQFDFLFFPPLCLLTPPLALFFPHLPLIFTFKLSHPFPHLLLLPIPALSSSSYLSAPACISFSYSSFGTG